MAHGRCTRSYPKSRRLSAGLWAASAGTTSVPLRMLDKRYLCSATSGEQRLETVSQPLKEYPVLTIFFRFLCLQRRANGVDISIDASELEGMSEEELRRRYDQHSRGNAGVPGANGREDFSDMIAKEMHKKKQKADREREGRKEKDFKF